jgi:ubiquinone/menaquinone biosynthesis C-methylase UbiE
MTDVDRRPVIYAGRFIDLVGGAALPDDCIVLGEQDALPHKLSGLIDRANPLVVLDLPSFPLEVMTADFWNVPMVVVLPSGLDADSLFATFGTAFFERLGFFDRIVAPDPALWKELRRKYRWAESQHIPARSEDPGDIARTVCATLQTEPSSAPKANDTGPRFNKALHRLQAAALAARFAAARGEGETGTPLDVLDVGAGAGRWSSSFDPTDTRYVGIDAREDMVGAARADFPERRFDLLGSDLLFPYEDASFDLVFSVTIMHRYPAPAKRTLLSEMWRVTRPGGQLLCLENFVFPREREEAVNYPMSVTKFVDLVLDATAGQVVLEHAESLRYPGENLHRGGLISLLRLGIPRTK